MCDWCIHRSVCKYAPQENCEHRVDILELKRLGWMAQYFHHLAEQIKIEIQKIERVPND